MWHVASLCSRDIEDYSLISGFSLPWDEPVLSTIPPKRNITVSGK